MPVGSELKAARTKAGISVEEISKRTKIHVSKLVALEKNDFKNLPTGLYLFSTVRAYAREVHIDPEPIVERLRTEFADKDALENLADARSPKKEQSKPLRNAAIAAGVVLMATAGAGAGAYLHHQGRIAHEVRGTTVERSSAAPTVNPPTETPSVSLPSPTPTPVATAVDVPEQAAGAAPTPTPTKTRRPKPRSAAVKRGLQETVGTVGDVSDALGSAHIEELGPEPPVLATAP